MLPWEFLGSWMYNERILQRCFIENLTWFETDFNKMASIFYDKKYTLSRNYFVTWLRLHNYFATLCFVVPTIAHWTIFATYQTSLTFIFTIWLLFLQSIVATYFFKDLIPTLKQIGQIKVCIIYWDNFRSSQYSVLYWNEVQKLNFLICFVRFLGFCSAAGSSQSYIS